MSRITQWVRRTVLAAAVPFAVHAASPGAPVLSAWERVSMEASFSKADTNQDGQLNRAEAMLWGCASECFSALDANRDELLDLGEYAARVASAAPVAQAPSLTSRVLTFLSGQSLTVPVDVVPAQAVKVRAIQ